LVAEAPLGDQLFSNPFAHWALARAEPVHCLGIVVGYGSIHGAERKHVALFDFLPSAGQPAPQAPTHYLKNSRFDGRSKLLLKLCFRPLNLNPSKIVRDSARCALLEHNAGQFRCLAHGQLSLLVT
jgi:hypothetical protein